VKKTFFDRPAPWLIAHRGGSALAPENTFAAFERAQALGADVIETDVRLTRDGVVVVFHDDDTMRLLGQPGTIEERTLEELHRLDAGGVFTPDGGRTYPHRGRGLRVPTFAEVLARHPGMRFVVDAKVDDPALARALVLTVADAGARGRVCLGSFFDPQADRIGVLAPDVARYFPQEAATCHVLAARSGAPGEGCPQGFDLASLPHRLEGGVVVNAEVVAYFHRLHIPVHVWTVDEEAEMRELLALGVDGIVTDRPDVLARVLGR
jgi:glycerophosphoryl diester phosphodiesterase